MVDLGIKKALNGTNGTHHEVPKAFQDAIKKKNAQQLSTIPAEWRIAPDNLPPAEQLNVTEFTKTCGILSSKELEIVQQEAGLLLADMAAGRLSCYDVAVAYCKAAAVAHQVTNCLTEIFFAEAMEHAKSLDDTFAKTGKPTGPLFGLPISLKDQFQIKGTECNMGIASWIGHISDRNSVLVDILLGAGAVLHCRTNISQALMFAESDNFVYGKSLNPFNRNLTPGGSSGGEGAVVAMFGSAVGVGTDLGGSVRIPAAYCGLYGLRPTLHRLPYRDARNSLLGMESIGSALGPLSKSISGVQAFTQAVIESKPWFIDPKTPELPWRQEMCELKHLTEQDGTTVRKPVFGLMSWDENVMPWPPVRRALKTAADALKAQGYEVIEFKPPYSADVAESIVTRVYSSDGGEDLKRTFAKSGEPRHPMIVTTKDAPNMSTYDAWQLNLEKDAVANAWIDAWRETAQKTSTGLPIDGLLLPPSLNCAHKHGEWPRYIIYTSLFNMIDYPAMSIPINSYVDPAVDKADSAYQAANNKDAELQSAYHPEDFAGAPLSVQLVCRRFREEEIIGLTKVIESALRGA